MEVSIVWRSIQLAEQQHHLASHRDSSRCHVSQG